ncbi:MAG: secondary thiamine-phosphate synthase enzyme YjbQ [Moorellales bacterium]
MWQKITVETHAREELVDVTRLVSEAVRRAGVRDGVCYLYIPHTTAGITVNENADLDVKQDLLSTLSRLVPRNGPYEHREGNADAHVKSLLVGHSALIPVQDGRLALGTWQGIFFCEFDGPRRRFVLVSVR